MGFRFRKSIRIFPGLKLNISKGGLSTTLGGRGAAINIGKRGIRKTIGLPGSGMSYSTLSPWQKSQQRLMDNNGMSEQQAAGCAKVFLACVAVLVVLAGIGASRSPKEPIPAIAAAAETPTGTVTAKSLRCRSTPSMHGTVSSVLAKGNLVSILDKQPEWIRVRNNGQECWVSSKYLST